MKKHSKAGKAKKGRSGRKPHKAARAAMRKASVSRVSKRHGARHAKKHAKRHAKKQQRQPRQPKTAAAVPVKKAADEVPTLEQVTITCANCGRPFKLFKLKGLSLEGTICQRCSLGEMELPESFG